MAAKTAKGITVVINGKTTGLEKAIEAVKKKSIGLNKELREVNKVLKFNPTNTTLLAEKQKILAESVKAAADELKTLENVQNQVAAQYKTGDIDRGAYLEFQRKLEAARANLQRLKEEQMDFGGVAAQVMQEAGKAVQDFGGKVEGVGKKLMPLSATTAAAGGAAVKMAWDFEDSMAKVATIADETEVPLEQLEEAIIELSDETGIAAGEIAENVYNAISAGQSTGDAVNFVREATNLARAGFADSGDALDLLTTIMNAYGKKAEEVTNISDTLIATQNLGKTTVAELSSSMGKIIPTANAANVGLEQVAAGYALMTANGVATAESTTYMNSMLNELNKSGTTVSDTLQNKTGKGFSDLMAEGYSLGDVLGIVSTAAEEQNLKFTDMWGSSEAAKAGLILLGNSATDVENGLVEAGGTAGQFNEMLAGIQAGAGGTAEALEKLDTTNRKTEAAINKVKNAALDFGQVAGEILTPYIEKLAGFVEKATRKFKNMNDGQKKAVVTITGIVAAAGPLLTVGGKTIGFIGGIITKGSRLVKTFSHASTALKAGASAFSLVGTGAKMAGVAITVLSNPITGIVAGFAAVVAGVVLLYNKCEWFRDGVNAVGSAIATGWNTAMEGVKTTAKKGLEALQTTTKKKLDAVRSAYEENGGGLRGIVAATMTGIKEAHTFGLDFIDNLTGGKLSAIADKFRNSPVGKTWTSVMTTVQNAAKTGMDALQTTTQQKLDAVRSAYEENGGGIKGATAAAMEGVKGCFTFGLSFIDNLTGGKLSSIASAFSSKLSSAKSTVSSVMDSIKGAFAEKIEKARSAVSGGIEKIKGIFDFSWSLPSIKLPHFSVSGGKAPWGFGGKGSLPKVSVQWYKEGGVLNGAQIFGAMGKKLLGGGESGPEAVLPLRTFYAELDKILTRVLNSPENGPTQFNQYNTYNSPKDLSPAECARQTRNETRKLLAAVRLT